jgi:uncharacterized membrane protein
LRAGKLQFVSTKTVYLYILEQRWQEKSSKLALQFVSGKLQFVSGKTVYLYILEQRWQEKTSTLALQFLNG